MRRFLLLLVVVFIVAMGSLLPTQCSAQMSVQSFNNGRPVQPPVTSQSSDQLAKDEAALQKAQSDKVAADKARADFEARYKAETDKITIDEAEAIKAATDKRIADVAAAVKAAADKAAADKAAAAKEAADKAKAAKLTGRTFAIFLATEDKAATDKAAADEAAAVKSAADKAAADSAAAVKAAMDKAAADKAATEKAAADEAAVVKAAADKAALDAKAIADKAEADKKAAKNSEDARAEDIACQWFNGNRDPNKPPDRKSAAVKNIGLCISLLSTRYLNLGTSDTVKDIATLKTTLNVSTQDQVDQMLITDHYLSRLIKRWIAFLKDPANTNSLASIENFDTTIHTLMEGDGLLDPFAGFLVAGPAFGETGKLAPNTTSTGTGSTSIGTTGTAAVSAGSKTNALAHIEWSSKHFGEDSFFPVDFSFGGSFGLQPTLTLLTNPPPAGTTTTSITATTSEYQSAFVWDLNSHFNYKASSSSEASAVMKAGQLRLLSGNGATIVDQGTNSTLQIPLNSNADRLSWFYEFGAEYKFYAKAMELIHAERGQLDPAFEIGASYKIDTRLSQNAGVVGFDSPDRRMVFHFMINGLKIIDKRPDTTQSKPYSISFGVVYERGFGTNRIPSGTSIIIRGDINLLKLINPGSGS